MKKKINSTVLSIHTMFLGLTIIFVFVPLPGLVTSSVLMLLPTIVMAQIRGVKDSLFQGAILGILLFIKGFVPVSPTDIVLINPMISILPRLLVGLFTCLLTKLGLKIIDKINRNREIKDKNNKSSKLRNISSRYILSSIVSFIASLLNSGLVLGMFYIFYVNQNIFTKTFSVEFLKSFSNAGQFILIVFTTVSVWELLVTFLVAPPIVIASDKAMGRMLQRHS